MSNKAEVPGIRHVVALLVSASRATLFLSGFMLAGCSGPVVEQKPQVAGRVIVAGKGPLTGGTIQFVPAKGPIGAGMIKADGTYVVTDAPIGECRVVVNNQNLARAGGEFVTPSQKMGKELPGEKGLNVPPQMAGKVPEAGKYMVFEDQFATLETTPLRATLQKGANTIDFELK